MKQLDVLFVNPNIAKINYQDLANLYTAIEPPTWSLLLAEACRSKGFGVQILDCDAERLTDNQVFEAVKLLNPRLVCFVTYSQNPNGGTTNMVGTFRLARILHDNGFKTASIGSHTSALPQDVLGTGYFDFIFLNDGTKGLLQLLSTDLKTDLHKINGMGYLELCLPKLNSGIGSAVTQDEMDHLLPGYAWDLIDLSKYRDFFWHTNYNLDNRSPYAAIYTSLGCVKKCSFCMINIINRENTKEGVHAADSAIMKHWSHDWVMKELEKLQNLGVVNIRFSDELFFLNRRYYEPVLNSIVERGYNINSWAYARIDTIKTKYLELFRKAGVNYLGIGIEAASQQIRREIDKGMFEEVDIRKVRTEVRDSGINAGLNYIFGFPNERLEDMQQTLDLALELQGEFSNFYCATCLPGSPLYYEAIENGWELPDTLDGYSFFSYNHLPSRTHHLTAAEVLEFRDKAWQIYYTDPGYLNMIESKFGQIARKNIEDQTKIKLRRRIIEERDTLRDKVIH